VNDTSKRNNGVGRVGKVQGPMNAGAQSSMQKIADLQILGCEIHKKAFSGRAPPGPAGEAVPLPETPSRYKGRGRRKGEEKGWEY